MTTPRTRDPAAKRQALLDAGVTVAEERGLTRLSVNLVTAEAKVAKGTFFHLFGDRATYLVELHRTFHDRLADDIDHATAQLPPGSERLVAGTLVYLDGCLRDRGTRALLVEAQAEPDIVAEVATRNRAFTTLAEPDFAAMGWPNPAHAARLWVVMCREVAVAESEAGGQKMPELRKALTDYLRRG